MLHLKTCNKCCDIKNSNEFYKDKRNSDGLRSYCKKCVVKDTTIYNKQNPGIIKKAAKRYREKNPKDFLWYRFGITEVQYNEMLKLQNGVCKICKKPETRKTGRKEGAISALVVDHCHTTGKIRGLLCSKHNTALGLFGDSTELLTSAITYLEHSRGL